MTHLDDGRLRALMDQELGDADVEAVRLHLEDCEACQHRVAELEGRAAMVAQALARLDTAAPAAGARDAVLERIGSLPSEERTRARFLRTPFARAAMLALLLGAGAVTALPASPVRGWIAAGWARATSLLDSSDDEETTVGPAGVGILPIPDGGGGIQSIAPAGVRLDATGREISIVLRGIGPDALIVVRMVPGGEAGVFAFDPATFRTSEGRIEVIGAEGRVLVDLPRDAVAASIEVNGGIYLRKEGDRIDATGPIEARTTDEIHLRVQ